MGQSSTFLTNRQGTFQFWNDVWDSTESFQKSNLEHILIKNCLTIFLKNKNYVNWRFFEIKDKDYWSDFFFLNENKYDLENYWIDKKKVKKTNLWVISCFIFKYQNWFFFFIYYYNSTLKKIKILTLEENSINLEENFYSLNLDKNFF